MDCREIIKNTETLLMSDYQKKLDEASFFQLHNSISQAIMSSIAPSWKKSREKHASVRRAYYFSAEYLMGRMIYNNLYSLGILSEIKELLAERNIDIAIFDEVDDVALGNGGLGRLAACFLDSAATHNIPLDGYGLRYKYGLFSQRIENGAQREYADNWQKFGDPWSKRRDDESLYVTFGDRSVVAVPYDMPIIGYKTDNIGTLRLFQCEAINEFDLSRFNNYEYSLSVHEKNIAEDITRVVYPSDNTYEGKRLRLRQQYFLSSAGMQDILRRYKRSHTNIYNFDAHCAVQLNDTHPTIAIPELIRLLIKEGVSFDDSFDIAQRTFSYTNHTVMIEALESWDISLFCSVAPHMYEIICKINDKLNTTLHTINTHGANTHNLQIVKDNKIYMANLASYVGGNINGVAKIHTEILKNDVLSDWYKLFPNKFQNKTNGITQRRFLGVCNPMLTDFIRELLGTDAFLTDLDLLDGLKNHISDENIQRFADIKKKNKVRLAHKIESVTGIYLPSDFIFDVQIKRLHEYKRQLMNAFSIYTIYRGIKSGEIKDFTPTAFIFGAKAAPGYARAKGVIKYINEVAKLVNSDNSVSELMKVVFIPDYNTSYAEVIIPAADISEQISPVGTEASGTGNMKLMLNGAVTLGTYDGANIEIAENAGFENNYIFGKELKAVEHEHYNPMKIYQADARIRAAVDTLIDGTFSDDGTNIFRDLHNAILYGASWHSADPYFILRDFNDYMDMRLKANKDFKHSLLFYKKCMMNTASAGKFSSDRTIHEYAKEIWHVAHLK